MRKFTSIRTYVIAMLFAGFASGFVSCEKPVEQKNVGLQLYSLRDAMGQDVKGTVEKVGAMGYKFVEAAGYNDGKFYGMDPVDFKNLCETNGIQFLGSHTGRDLPEEGGWDETMAWWDQ